MVDRREVCVGGISVLEGQACKGERSRDENEVVKGKERGG